eukprot:TRINITY_DN15582_c0_g1_i1.p1 TRINITY_DN15582_c0_g1~~TRINITY_DN15582_c0_g1_i1.p1  ORF type:complete len:1225 (+),score=245.77 TRINITY_DN15582_c0_g1_i1:234-3677(+)
MTDMQAGFPQAGGGYSQTEAAHIPDSTATEGLLLSQLGALMAPKLQSPVEASSPNERERRLWDRVLAAEQLAQADSTKEGLRAFLTRQLLFFVSRLALVVVLGAPWCITQEKWSMLVASIATAFPSLSPGMLHRMLLASLSLSTVTFLSFFRPALLILLLLLAVIKFQPGLFSIASLREESINGSGSSLALFSAASSYPGWCGMCTILSCAAVLLLQHPAFRYFWRLLEIYVTSSLPIGIYFSCRSLSKALKLSDQRSTELLFNPADRFVAPFLANRFSALGGLFVKLGQWLANMSYVVPVTWQEHLKRLQDSAPSSSSAHVRAAIEAAFGCSVEDAFSEFDFTPVASASIGQVHKATMRDSGQKVAVKLQHEGVEAMIRSDLSALKRILAFSCWLGGRNWDDVKRTAEGWMNEMIHELDFRKEVANLIEVRQGLQAAGVDVVVPKELEGWVSQRAFVMEFCEGFRFTDLDQLALYGVSKTALGARAVHAVAAQLLEIGVFNSDPHAGNLLCQVKGETAVPVLLDFGNCIRLPDDKRLAYCKLLVSLSEGSVTNVREATANVGIVSNQVEDHPARDMEYMMMLFRDTGGRKNQQTGMRNFQDLRKSQRKADFEALDESVKKNKKLANKQTSRYPAQMPDEAVLFFRMLLLVRGLCSQLDVQLPFMQLFEMHARRALACRFPQATRALQVLPSFEGSAERSIASTGHKALCKLIQDEIRRCCMERPGLGVQVCVYIGDACAVDECGGVLGPVDPRPMMRSSKVPLAELARLPWLLALYSAERRGKIKYGDPLPALSSDSLASSATLSHGLAHRTIVDSGPRGEAVLSSTVADLRNRDRMHSRLSAALSPEPSESSVYLPIGVAYMAAAVLQGAAACTDASEALQAYLPALQGISDELGIGMLAEQESLASLSSSLFADMRSLATGSSFAGKGAPTFMGPFIVGSSEAEKPLRKARKEASARKGDRDKDSSQSEEGKDKSSSPKQAMASLARSILDAAGGLLADMGMANAAAVLPAEVCPDLACAASARSLAKMLAAANPAGDPRPVLGREAAPAERDTVMNALLAHLAPPLRSWDGRGFQVLETEGERSATGLTSCGGLLGAAVQWPTQDSTVTAVALCNELSVAAVPSQLLATIAEGLTLPRLATLP